MTALGSDPTPAGGVTVTYTVTSGTAERPVGNGTSGIDGLVTFIPANLPGVATNLQAIAATGNTAILPVAIEQHP